MLHQSALMACVALASLASIGTRPAAEGFAYAGHAVASELSSPEAAARVFGASQAIPSRGRVHALVILAQFPNAAADNAEVPDYTGSLFDPNPPGGLTHFYHTMSFGQLVLEGTVLPKRYRSDASATAYLSPEREGVGRFGPFVLEVLARVDQEVDLRPLDGRRDLLVYTAPPLEESVEVLGPVVVKLWATSSARDTDFVAR